MVRHWRFPARRRARTSPTARAFIGNALLAFGVVSALVQFVGQLYPEAIADRGAVTTAALGCCAAWGAFRARPQRLVRHEFGNPPTAVVVKGGDLFAEPGHIVIGFCDTFDTDVEDGVLVNADSTQGQLLDRRYAGDRRHLDAELGTALHGTAPVVRLNRAVKPRGKLSRYPIGTVAVLGSRPRLVFAVAYSRLALDYVAAGGVDELWYSLARLWDAVFRHAQQERVAMPLVGAGLARLGLDDESLLRLVLLSFVAHSRRRRVCRELCVVMRPEAFRRIDMGAVEAFLVSLGR
ncbi:hypothetical protein GCM10009839_27740 [Catenulispora yoronensis]|uniref:Thoeris protein ThsA Macro domain-containing protein n=1 Tax=Catenulispora yoronensis TaxID=450799 RepID=A0ABP5FMF6_9ACTN